MSPVPRVRRQPLVVAGAGPAGGLLALQTAGRGYRVKLFEKRRRAKAVADHRSINLAIGESSLDLLEQAGVDEVRRRAVRLRGRVVHGRDQSARFTPYLPDRSGGPSPLSPAEPVFSVARLVLSHCLSQACLDHDAVELVWGRPLVDLDPVSGAYRATEADGSSIRGTAWLIAGADGSRSAVRSILAGTGQLTERLTRSTHRYSTFRLPASQLAYQPHEALHLWPRQGTLLIGLPNPDGSLSCTLFRHFPSDQPAAMFDTVAELDRFLEEALPDLETHRELLQGPLVDSPASELISVECDPWSVGRAVLLGDACHAVLPFTGQGANAALADADALATALEKENDPVAAVKCYRRQRARPVQSLVDWSRTFSPLLLSLLSEKDAV